MKIVQDKLKSLKIFNHLQASEHSAKIIKGEQEEKFKLNKVVSNSVIAEILKR